MSQVSHFPADIAQHFPINLWLTSNKNIPRESKAPLNKFEIVQLCSDIFLHSSDTNLVRIGVGVFAPLYFKSQS